jgi:membrane associated rhomboid family serine protease
MKSFLSRCCESKRECITYLVVFLWVAIGVTATYFDTNFTQLAGYFISLTGFVASYILGESMRPSSSTSIFRKGKNSKREKLMYITIVLWTIIGVCVIVKNADLMGAAAYFAALTPFVGSYIIGETFKKDGNSKGSYQQINS